MSTWTVIDRLDAPSGGVFDFPSLTLTGYVKVQIVLCGIQTGTDQTDIQATLYVGGVEQTGATAHRWTVAGMSQTGSVITDGDTSDPNMRLVSNDVGWDIGNDTSEGYDGILELDEPNSTVHHKRISFESAHTNHNGNFIAGCGVGVLQNAGAINGLKISGSNAFTAGSVILLGLA